MASHQLYNEIKLNEILFVHILFEDLMYLMNDLMKYSIFPEYILVALKVLVKLIANILLKPIVDERIKRNV